MKRILNMWFLVNPQLWIWNCYLNLDIFPRPIPEQNLIIGRIHIDDQRCDFIGVQIKDADAFRPRRLICPDKQIVSFRNN